MTPPALVRALLAVAGLIPAILIVLFAGVISAIALVLDGDRRLYALDLVDRFTALASVLIGGGQSTRPGPARQQKKVQKPPSR